MLTDYLTAHPHVEEDTHGVGGELTSRRRLLYRDPLRIGIQIGQQAGFPQGPTGLKQHGGEGDLLGFCDGFQRRERGGLVWL